MGMATHHERVSKDVFPKVLLLCDDGDLCTNVRKTIREGVVQVAKADIVKNLPRTLGHYDVLLIHYGTIPEQIEGICKAVKVFRFPVILVVDKKDEPAVLETLCHDELLTDYVLNDDIIKLPFIIENIKARLIAELDGPSDPYTHEGTDAALFLRYRVKKLITYNLQLLDELVKKERAMRLTLSQEHKFRDIVENSADVVYSTDYNGRFTYVNPKVLELTGYTAKELVGVHYLDLVDPLYKTDVENFYQKQFTDRIEESVKDFPIVTKEGERKWVEQTVKMIGTIEFVKGFYCIVRDITERKKLEEKLAANTQLLERSNKELEMFAYIASHDLKEPLRKIISFSSRLMQLPELTNVGDRGKDYLDRMNNAVKRMEILIEDLLHYSRVSREDSKFEKTDLNVILKEVLDDLEEHISSSSAVIKSDKLPVIMAIPSQMRQLFQNILSNSIKFVEKGKTPEIEIRAELIKMVTVVETCQNPEAQMVKLTFSDKGIGFDNQYAEKIFQVFQRLHGRSEFPGTGIGLAVVKKIVEMHSGKITSEGKPGVGAQFTLYLPLEQLETKVPV